ncbi:unnamed protein product, partial [Larinioides sclopetarius]
VKRKYPCDIESLCADLQKQVALRNQSAPKKISTMMLPPPGHSSSKAENSSAVGNKTLVKILPPPRFE